MSAYPALRPATSEESAVHMALHGNAYLGPDGWLVPVDARQAADLATARARRGTLAARLAWRVMDLIGKGPRL